MFPGVDEDLKEFLFQGAPQFEITPRNGCGGTTMNAQIWHWAASPPKQRLAMAA